MPAPAPQAQPAAKPPGFGTSPATQATPNHGYQAAGMQKLGLVVKVLSEVLPLVGANSEVGEAVLKAIQSLAKHVPPGALSPAGENQQLQNMQLKASQNNGMMQQMKQMGAGTGSAGGMPPGAAGGGGGMPMGGAAA